MCLFEKQCCLFLTSQIFLVVVLLVNAFSLLYFRSGWTSYEQWPSQWSSSYAWVSVLVAGNLLVVLVFLNNYLFFVFLNNYLANTCSLPSFFPLLKIAVISYIYEIACFHPLDGQAQLPNLKFCFPTANYLLFTCTLLTIRVCILFE